VPLFLFQKKDEHCDQRATGLQGYSSGMGQGLGTTLRFAANGAMAPTT
jgi:hypothetical protein